MSKSHVRHVSKGNNIMLHFQSKASGELQKKIKLIHLDLCGLVSPPSNNQIRYFISFIDDFSRKTWIYFLIEKSEAFKKF